MPRSIPCTLLVPLVLLVSLLLTSACTGLGHFAITETGSTTVPKATLTESLLGTIAFTGFDNFSISQDSAFKNQGLTANEVRSVVVKSFTLQITAPPDQDFSFLSSLAFYAGASDPNSGQASNANTLVASGSQFGNATQIALQVTGAQLVQYLSAPSMTITTDATGRPPANDTTIDANVVFDVGLAGP